MLVGNDVVDLQDGESDLADLHPRYIERVFTLPEQALIETADAPNIMLWSLWAAKEAAFKVTVKMRPHTVFSPRRFAVSLTGTAKDNSVFGSEACRAIVVTPWKILPALLEFGYATSQSPHVTWVHALVASGGCADFEEVVHRVELVPSGRLRDALAPGQTARDLAISTLTAKGHLIEGQAFISATKPPEILERSVKSPWDLSLSHHGRFAAFAATARSTY